MSQTDNNLNNVLSSLSGTANAVGVFLNDIQKTLTPEQKEMLDKQLAGQGGLNSQMEKVNKDLAQALKDLNNFNTQK